MLQSLRGGGVSHLPKHDSSSLPLPPHPSKKLRDLIFSAKGCRHKTKKRYEYHLFLLCEHDVLYII